MAVLFSLQRAAKSHIAPVLDEGIFLEGKGRQAILLIHGLTGSPSEMSFLARSFHRQGYTVFVPRMAGHGDSLFVLKKKKWEDFYQSIRVAFETLRERCGPETSLFVGGLSMGALLALLIAREYPTEVVGVVSLSATLFFDGWNVPWTQHLLPLGYHTPLRHFFYFREETPYGLKSETVRRHVDACYRDAKLDDFSDASRNGYAFFPVTLFHQLNRLIRHLIPRLSEITVPIQIQQATEDDMSTPRNSDFIYQQVRSRIKEIFLLEDSYHVITADQERSTVAEKAIEFCNRQVCSHANALASPAR